MRSASVHFEDTRGEQRLLETLLAQVSLADLKHEIWRRWESELLNIEKDGEYYSG